MTMVGGWDVHRQQITFDYVDDDGLVRWGQMRPATRKTLRGWLAEHCVDGDAEFALEGSPGLRWAAFEAAKCAARCSSPDYGYYHKLAAKRDGHNGKNPTLAVERKILRRCHHTLRALGEVALALPVPEREEAAA